MNFFTCLISTLTFTFHTKLCSISTLNELFHINFLIFTLYLHYLLLSHQFCSHQLCLISTLHCGSYKHLVAIANIKCPKNTVFVYNSSDENVPHDILEQICNIIQSSYSVFTVQSKPMQIQEGHNDCMLFAIVSLFTLCSM